MKPVSRNENPKGGQVSGVVSLLTVIVIGAMTLAIGLSIAFIGQTAAIVSGHTDRQYTNRMLVSACVEESLHRLKLNAAYAGGTIPLGTSSCTVSVSGIGLSRSITASATVDGYTTAIVVAASLKANVPGNAQAWHVDTWTESNPP